MSDAPARRPWTLMIYMAGDNGKVFDSKYGPIQLMASMSEQVYSDLLKMGAVGTTDIAAVTCLCDTTSGSFAVEVRQGEGFANSLVTPLPDVNTGDPATLSQFIIQSVQNYPADHYALVIWNHGAGWLDVDAYAPVRALGEGKSNNPIFRTTPRKLTGGDRTRPIAFDDSSKDFLDTADLRQAFAAAEAATGARLSLIGMDACLMAMIEGDRELAPYADYFVASQEVEPMYGWPYGEILAALNASPAMAPDGLARTIVEKYAGQYGGRTRADETVTQAATALVLTARTEELCKALVDVILQNESATLRRLLWTKALPATLKFEDPNYRDLGDFALQVATVMEYEDPPEVAAAARSLYEHLQARNADSPVLNVGFLDTSTDQSGYARATGMSVYLPDDLPGWQREQTLSIYRQLGFPQRTGWDRLVSWLLGDD